ncbi:hypothetical protein Glove_443g6 [Diversispora epigaea]|uniref:Retrotransposon gag domain-containing protein n=1 Tax=Diversispora epigaea TaxID=1348612 RepID=A0A397GQH4_9GLOM|nr:hypothetical protein Glove_443g6 [Diversispora epigaea]
MADWTVWRTGFVEKYCNTRWKNKWMRELENNRQRQGETVDAYYTRFRRLVKRVDINDNQHKRLFIKGLLPHIAPLITMQAPGTLAAALELAQVYEEGLDMVNEIEPRKQKGKKKVVESSDEEEEEEVEEERKSKKTVLKKKKKETKVTFDPAHNLDDLAKKFKKMQLNLIQKMEKLTTQVNQQPNYHNRGNNRDNSLQNNWNNRNNRNNRNNNRETRTCFKCGKEGHISWDYPDRKDNSDNSAHAKLVEVEEESEKEEDKLLQHLLEAYDAYLGKRERDDSSDEDTPIKRPRETNIPEPKSSLNTFGLPKTMSTPVPKVVKTEITPKKKSKKKKVIKMVKGNKEKKKENATRPPLFRKKDFDIVEKLQNQPAGLSWADALEVPSIRKSFFEALRKPKEKEIKLADQEYSLKTTALKYNVAVGVYTVPTIVDSGVAISIVTRDAMEQLGYEIEEASKSIILPATGKKTQPLGVIRDLPITIQGQTIPIDVEVIDAATYSLLLGNNWLMKANASYNWSDQELTLRWRGKTLTVPANCSKETKEEFPELSENMDEESTNESDTETEESEEDDDEIIFKNTTNLLEKEIKLADQEYSLKTTALKYNVAVGVYTVPTIVDSGVAISIVTRDAMEQLGYEIEEASKSIILPATGKKTQPLGVIRDLPITIQGQTIPIDVEVIDAATYSLLLGNNWLMKANASYNWSDQELTLRWRGKTLTVPANCSKETKEEFPELSENMDEESTNESDTETEESEEDDDEIIFKNTTIEDRDDKSDEDTVSVFLSEKLNKNELDIGQLNNHQQQKFDKLMEQNKDLFAMMLVHWDELISLNIKLM